MKEFIVTVNNPPKSGYYAIVPGTSLTGAVPGEYDEYFWGYHSRGTREDYEQLILDSQPFIKKVMSGDVDADDNSYYIYGCKQIELFLVGKHVDKMNDNAFKGSSWITKPVMVHKQGKKYVYAGWDGRHRFAAGRGKDCYIIVYVRKSYS